MAILQKAAEILVECGYAKSYDEQLTASNEHCYYWLVGVITSRTFNPAVDPFADTLEGRKQLEAIWGWFFTNHRGILMANLQFQDLMQLAEHGYVCSLIKRCLKQLEKLDQKVVTPGYGGKTW